MPSEGKVLRRSFLIMAVCLMPLTAMAQNNIITAKNLLEVCTTPDMHWVDFCNGFFQAAHDSGAVDGKVCTPAGVTRTQLVELYEQRALRLFQINPVIGDAPGVEVVRRLLAKEYPCK